MHLFFSREISNGIITLNEEETNHCNRVLRLKAGESVGVLDGKGNLYRCTIAEQSKKFNKLSIIEIASSNPGTCNVHIALAPTKQMDRNEWFVEKATELGIREISFLECKRSERKKINAERLQKIAVSALKQSGNRYLPAINPIVGYDKFLDSLNFNGEKFIAHIDESVDTPLAGSAGPGNDYLLLIGPEGDFTKKEVALADSAGFKPVSLGKPRFRTETAALVGLQTLILINQLNS